MGRCLITSKFTSIFVFLMLFNVFDIGNAGLALSKYKIIVLNDIIQKNAAPLKVHCQSKDNDLGYHILPFARDLDWSFRANFWATTRFYCHFWWGRKQRAFDVFYDGWSEFCDAPKDSIDNRNYCFWVVRTDGFYFSNRLLNSTLERKYTWQ